MHRWSACISNQVHTHSKETEHRECKVTRRVLTVSVADIPVDGLSLNSLHRQLYALGQHGAARELEDLFEKVTPQCMCCVCELCELCVRELCV